MAQAWNKNAIQDTYLTKMEIVEYRDRDQEKDQRGVSDLTKTQAITSDR